MSVSTSPGTVCARSRSTRGFAARRRTPVRNIPNKHPCSLHGTTACRLEAAAIRSALVGWATRLDTAWTHFLTLTFRKPIPSHLAMNAGASYVRWVSGWRDSVLRTLLCRCSLWSVEGHSTGNAHVHALLACTQLTSFEHMTERSPRDGFSRHRACRTCGGPGKSEEPLWHRLKESWFKHYGIARVYPYDPTLRMGAEGYVVKYVLDEKCLDWGVVGG